MAKKTSTVERKPRVSRVPEGETKEQKFTRLANARVQKVLKALDQVGLLGSASYVSTEAQRTKIADSINKCVELNLNRLEKSTTTKSTFAL